MSASLRVFCFWWSNCFLFSLCFTTNSLIWSFHSEKYLRSTCSRLDLLRIEISRVSNHSFVDFQLILLGSWYFGHLATSSLNLTFPMTINPTRSRLFYRLKIQEGVFSPPKKNKKSQELLKIVHWNFAHL